MGMSRAAAICLALTTSPLQVARCTSALIAYSVLRLINSNFCYTRPR